MNRKTKEKIKNASYKAVAHARIIGLLYKEFKLLFRMKKAPILVLTLPILLIIIYSAGSNAISNPQTRIRVGVCNNDPNAENAINSLTGNFDIIRLNGEDCINEMIRRVKIGDLIIGFNIPSDFTSKLQTGSQGFINYYVDDSKPLTASLSDFFLEKGMENYENTVVTKAESQLKELSITARTKLGSIITIINTTSEVTDENKLILPIIYPLINNYLKSALNEPATYDKELSFVGNISVRFLTNPIVFSKEYLYPGVNASSFNFSSVYSIISLFTLLLLASSGVIFDKKTEYLLRIKATRTFMPTYLASKIIFFITISAAQLLIVMGLMSLQGAVYNFNIASLITAFAMISALNTSIGLLIGSLSENENVAILSSLMLSLPFLFLSGVFFPLEFMPDYIRVTADVVPLYKEITLLKQASVLNATMQEISPIINQLAIISLILLAITYVVIKKKN